MSKKVENKKNTKSNDINIRKHTKIYIGYYTRVILSSSIFLIFLFATIFFIVKSLNFEKAEYTNYKEKSFMDYKVYLKENNFYEEKYLGKDMIYIANLVNDIEITFDYMFTIDSLKDLNFSYQVMAKLIIFDSNNNKNYFEKTYNITEQETAQMRNSLTMDINKTVFIDYDYYNSIANTFKSNYGVNCESKLLVYMVINKTDTENNQQVFVDKNTELNISIPLSERSVNITLDYKDINKESYMLQKNKYLLGNVKYFVLGMFFGITSCISLIKVIKLLLKLKQRNSKYDKYIAELLTKYDRLIVETTNLPSFKDKDIIKVRSFSELVDVRDNLKVPIMYYVLSAHNKCYFYIYHNNIIYLNVIKSVDL